MKRTVFTAILAGFTLFSVGCCYRAGGCDPCTGMSYAGQYQPACFGPLDPFGMWCGGPSACCNGGAGHSMHQPVGSCCSQQPQYPTGYSAPMMTPQTFVSPGGYSNGMQGGMYVPNSGGMQPTPAPPAEESGSGAGKKSTMMLVPQPMPQGAVYHGAQAGQWVKAF